MIAALRRFGRHIWPLRRALFLGTLLTVVDVAISLAQPWPLQRVIDDILQPASGVAPTDASRQLAYAVGAMVALVLAGAVVSYWASRLLSAAGLHIAGRLRLDVIGKLNRLELAYHARHRVGDLTSRVTSDVDRTQDMIVQVLSTLFPNLLLLIGMFTVMVVVDPMFTLLALGATIPLLAATHRSRRQLRLAARRSRKADGELASAASENLASIHLVQAFTLETDRAHRFSALTASSITAGLDAVRLQSRFGPLVDVSGVAAAALVLWFGAQRVLDGSLSLGVLLVFLSYLGSLFKPVKALTKLANVVSKGTAAAERVASVLDTAPAIVNAPLPVRTRIKGRIELCSVSFSYGREPVLANIDLAIESGETVALVGPTGAGKSTIASLIPRLIDPTEGAVFIDGHNARDHDLFSLRSQVAMVLQDSTLLEGTLRDNILCGRVGATQSEVETAARLALVDEFATRLPDGLETRIGERGVNLSGGQRQRVAIARAILRDCPIIVLDEPTSALDAASEELLIEALANLPSGRTTIVIAHRLSTIRRSDRIVVLDRGRIIEQGSHHQLLARDGMYRRLATLQANSTEASAGSSLTGGLGDVGRAPQGRSVSSPALLLPSGDPATHLSSPIGLDRSRLSSASSSASSSGVLS